MNTTLQSERSPETTASDRSHRRFASLGVFVWLLISASVPLQGAAPIRLHPQNPHYFEWRGKPALLISSAEHYGGVLNLDFDYQKYIDRLSADGMNYTRVFSGAYVEPDGAFKIARNTLAPKPG
ncbi:MAG: hypothetical protein QHJ82_11860, partial [Verrucomicrobiota bacterium]|nr:hypothetical protein [Verrucomicrobiota bacterium]